MIDSAKDVRILELRLSEAHATVKALLSGEIDAVVDPRSNSPVLLAQAQAALRESERALRKSEAEYRQIVESTSDGILKVDRDNVITFVNARLAEMLGFTPTEMVGKTLLHIVAPSERWAVRSLLRSRDGGPSTARDTLYCHKSGAEISVNVAGSTLRDDAGNVVGFLGVVRDVTERKKLQAQLMVSDRMASVGTLAAGVAHEINNPLAAVMANLEFVDEGVAQLLSGDTENFNANWVRESIAEPLRDAREAADRVRFIVRDLMIFSRSPSDEPQQAVFVNDVLESSLRMGGNEIRHRADLIKNLGTVACVAVNEARLGQVFLNLVMNAAQALPVGHLGEHTIRVTTYQESDTAVIEISDTGCGIAPEAIGRVFDAFYTTKAVGVGTGLGLAICQRIVTDMGGSLTVKSEVGVGSTFRVCIPVAPGAVTDAFITPAMKHPGKSGRLLVVDDEESIARIVQRSLGSSYEIVAATSARAALALLEAGQRFDVILCDLMMPNMTGMELYHALLEQNPTQANHMMFMTGGAFTDEARQFIAGSGVVHVEKPFTLDLLRARVHDFVVALRQAV